MTNVKILDNMLEYYVKLNDDEKKMYLEILFEENMDLLVEFCEYKIDVDPEIEEV